ncbi:MAG TPA: hypothetical protein PLV42_04440 [bacterium]|nr:hypothetical protein [bacterium]
MASLEVDRTAFSVGDLTDNTEEKRYWLSRTPAERLEAIETNRRIVYGYLDTPPRLQMVLEIVNLADLDQLA